MLLSDESQKLILHDSEKGKFIQLCIIFEKLTFEVLKSQTDIISVIESYAEKIFYALTLKGIQSQKWHV